jgi:tRNA(fMet)-specific endonuclease VapC
LYPVRPDVPPALCPRGGGSSFFAMYMLDTHTALLVLAGMPADLVRLLETKKDGGLCISSITLAELEYSEAGRHPGEVSRLPLGRFLNTIRVKEFDKKAARIYGAIKRDLKERNSMLKPLNLLIGAHAKSLDMTLITGAPRDFAPIRGLKTEDWF